MEGVMDHLIDYEYLRRSRPNEIWEPRVIRNVILQILRKLRPSNRVPHRFESMLNFIIHVSMIETNWLTVASSLMENMPTCPYTIITIAVIMREIPSPQVTTVSMVLNEQYQLSQNRAVAPDFDIRIEKNICLVLNCLAEKLVGTHSTAIFTDNVCSYLCHIFINSRNHNDLELQMRALLALEKFAATKENKAMIVGRLSQLNINHLSNLETFFMDISGEHGVRREVGYCAKWALDNIFPKPGRQLSYDTVNIATINGMLKNDSGNIYLKYSPDLMEIRNDTILSQTLHGTCEVEEGMWFYEITMITEGSLTVGWASTGVDTGGTITPFFKLYFSGIISQEKSVGDDMFSLGYEGNYRLLWYNGNPYIISLGRWRVDEVLGCLLDITNKSISFFLNGFEVVMNSNDFFSPTRPPKKFFPAITIAPFQQCIVNFGQKPFRSAPEGVQFSALSSVGQLTPQQRMVIIYIHSTFLTIFSNKLIVFCCQIYGMPRSAMQERQASFNASEDACDICCDRAVDVTLRPCGHR
ncbi:RING finger and SPRY domain-containing protein 1 [Papilio machaon]|uniref:RING finger and SPRY domain-containing protein 1 n=1 Tax=Papilio machaon TaxID=76193 RepID=UPI001E665DDD|nr:RING finger and SPRY domain-containing protein 1 [Papilio machaon]